MGTFGTLRLNLRKISLRESGRQTLRLLLLGKDYIPSLRESIQGKVADALLASGSTFNTGRQEPPSRYHIVPDCFGPGSVSSAAELIPIDCQLEVESYRSAAFLDATHQTILLREQTSHKVLRSTSNGNEYVIDGDKGIHPDMAVIMVSSKDTESTIDQTCIMRRFAQRHAIPVLIISIDSDWASEGRADTLPFGHTNWSAHRCIEHDPADTEPVRRLPLDLDTFLQLEPAQLSRHLAYLVEPVADDAESSVMQSSSLTSRMRFWEKAWNWPWPAVRLPSVDDTTRLAARADPGLWTLLVSFIFMLVIYLSLGGMPDTPQPAPSYVPAAATVSSGLESVSTALQSSRAVTAAALAATAPSPPLTIDAAKSKSGRLEVEVVGDTHLVVRTSSKPKKNGVPTVTVSRDCKELDVKATPLFQYVYSVYVPQEEMYGNLTVKLEVTDPHSVETVTIDMGQPPLDLWIQGIFDKAERMATEKLFQIQLGAQGIWSCKDNGLIMQSIRDIRAAVSSAVRRGEVWTEPVRTKISLLEARVNAWNAAIDARGAEIFDLTRAGGVTVANRVLERVKFMKEKGRELPRYGLYRPSNPMDAIRSRLQRLQMGERFHLATRGLHDRAHSETLATAQHRAQYIAGSWRRGKKQDGRRAHR
jgi:hypothetical protein